MRNCVRMSYRKCPNSVALVGEALSSKWYCYQLLEDSVEVSNDKRKASLPEKTYSLTALGSGRGRVVVR